MNARQRRHLTATAYHDAGHAVASWALTVRFRYVTIEPEGDALGHVQWLPAPASLPLYDDTDPRTQRYLERAIIR